MENFINLKKKSELLKFHYYKNLKFIKNKDFDKINWKIASLISEPDIIPILEQNINKVDWSCLSQNVAAIHILVNNMDKVDKFWLSTNASAIYILEQNPSLIDWVGLHLNPEAFNLFEDNPDKIDWIYISCNFVPTKTTEKLIVEYPDKINWLYRDLFGYGYKNYSEITRLILDKVFEKVESTVSQINQ